MIQKRSLLTATSLVSLLFVAGCSNSRSKDALGGTSPPGTGGTLEIISCSLGCNTFQTTQISCNLNDVFVNEEIRIEFSLPVNLSSLKQSTFQVQETVNGIVPPGTFSADPSNPRGIIYRPLLTFDSSGNPVFGLDQGLSYEILLPGAVSGDLGPFITSTSGRPLGTRLRCIVTAGSGVNDAVAGAPEVTTRVNLIQKDALGNPVIDPSTGAPFFGPFVVANNQSDVHRGSSITFTFNDVMNPATLVNPVTKLSPSLRIFVDPDGNITDPTDQVEIFGEFQITLDQDQLQTTVTFDPATELPSAGPLAQILPRRVIASIPSTIVDLGGFALANANPVSFIPERLVFPLATLPRTGGEDFSTEFGDNDHGEDTDRTGAFWGPKDTTLEQLVPGLGGGSGRLGDLHLAAGQILTLYTDGLRPAVLETGGVCIGQDVDMVGTPLFVDQLFGPSDLLHVNTESLLACPGDPTASPAVPALLDDSQDVETIITDNYDPATEVPGMKTRVVRDGIFEFGSLIVEAGAVLRFVGPHSPRLFVRGTASVSGRLEINGLDGEQDYSPSVDRGGLAGRGGPGGGSGGRGGLRPDGGADLASVGGVFNPLFTSFADCDGLDGIGVPTPSGVPGMPIVAGQGLGGTRWPNATACVGMSCDLIPATNPGLMDFGGVLFGPFAGCLSDMTAGPGSGGGKTDPGGLGVPVAPPLALPGSVPPQTLGGAFPLDSASVALRFEAGFLTGGPGGGGGGGMQIGARRQLIPFPTSCIGGLFQIGTQSGAGGGGGGGALQFQAGRRLSIDGVVDASGGRGGRPVQKLDPANLDERLVAPGGSGAGGSVLLQTLDLQLASLAGRLNISGGPSSVGNLSTGGSGGTGFVRVEAGRTAFLTVPGFTSIVPTVTPIPSTDPANPGTWLSVAATGWLQLNANQFFGMMHPNSGDTMSYFPDAMSGAQSCWMQPPGNFFRLTFLDDDPGTLVPGWNMMVTMADGSKTPYRAATTDPNYPNTIEGGFAALDGQVGFLQEPPEVMAPTEGSAILIRFQGARAVREIDDLCDVPLTGPDSPLQPGSLTPWVLHPAELNAYWDAVFAGDPNETAEVSKRRSTMIRYQIIFNRTATRTAPLAFVGVDDVVILAQPD